MAVMEELEKALDEMYEFCGKMYEAIGKSGKDEDLAKLIVSAQGRDELFLAEQIMNARNSMDQTYTLIEYLHRPVILDGRLKKTEEGTYSLCGEEITKRVGIEYVQDDKWKFGLLQPDGTTGEFMIVDEKMNRMDISLENLRIRTREQIDG